MTREKINLVLAILLIPILSSCTNVVEIVQPPDANLSGGGYNYSTQPIEKFVVKIGSNYVSSFSADLDGAPVTTWFVPAASAGNTITAMVTSCFAGGTYLSGGNRNMHELIARANSSSTGIKIENDIADFVPPSVRLVPAGNVPVPLGQVVSVQMNLTDGPINAVPVTLVPDNTKISINSAVNGAPVTTSIPNNNIGNFTIRGVAQGPFSIDVKPRGVHCGRVVGYVN